MGFNNPFCSSKQTFLAINHFWLCWLLWWAELDMPKQTEISTVLEITISIILSKVCSPLHYLCCCFQWGLGNISCAHVFPQSSQNCPEEENQSQAFLQQRVAQTPGKWDILWPLGLFPHSQYPCKQPMNQVIDLGIIQDQMKWMNP